jgi:hypothetical protein
VRVRAQPAAHYGKTLCPPRYAFLSLTHLGSPGKYELNLVDFFQAASFMVKTLAEVEATNQPERFADMEMKVKFV